MGFLKSFFGAFQGNGGGGEDFNLDGLDDEGVKAKLRDLVESGRKIQAIKAARQAYGCGLKEAKHIVEQL